MKEKQYVQYIDKNSAFRIGRIRKINGKKLSIVVPPKGYGFKGKNAGSRVRINSMKVIGVSDTGRKFFPIGYLCFHDF